MVLNPQSFGNCLTSQNLEIRNQRSEIRKIPKSLLDAQVMMNFSKSKRKNWAIGGTTALRRLNSFFFLISEF